MRFVKNWTVIIGVVGLGILISKPSLGSEYPLNNVIPQEVASKLEKEKITSTTELLTKAGKMVDRKKLAKTLDIPLKDLTEWVLLSDMVRIKGIGPLMVKLFDRCGVKGVAKFRNQKATPLFKKMMSINDKEKITEKPPTEDQVKHWIEEAKKLPLFVK